MNPDDTDSYVPDLVDLGAAPEFVGNQRWFNTSEDRPLTLRSLRGRVVLVDFWTYSCINCIRTLPHLEALDRRYRTAGLTIVGVHSPEFPFEKDAGNVDDAINREGIRYPVALDNELATWNAYGNIAWPAEYFIDAKGRVRYRHYGEGGYATKERIVRTLLSEAGRAVGDRPTVERGTTPSPRLTTAESYLGAERADRFVGGAVTSGSKDYGVAAAPPSDHLAYGGRWIVGAAAATAGRNARLRLNFNARDVYLVLGSPGRQRDITVHLDGHPIPASAAGSDIDDGRLTVTSQRLYRLVHLPRAGRHQLVLEPGQGVTAYAFTFG